jgi:hypothetical protein
MVLIKHCEKIIPGQALHTCMMHRNPVTPVLSSLVFKSVVGSAECFPALNFVENPPPKKQMVPQKQGKSQCA